MAEALLISRSDITKHTSLNGSIDVDVYLNYIKIAQDKHIQQFLGTDLFESIQSKITGGTLTGDYLNLVTEYVKPMLIHWSMVEALPFLGIQIANNGIFRPTSENGSALPKEEVDYLIEKERDTAQYYTERFIDYMSHNAASKFPEYYTNTNEDVSPTKDSDYEGWVL
tara:strand:+ start:92 stop:595 length:504 start_codon:yes stop_codon:yes gene_type:complete